MECDMCEQGVEGILAFPFVTITRVEKGSFPKGLLVWDSQIYFSQNYDEPVKKVPEEVRKKFESLLNWSDSLVVDGWQWNAEQYSWEEKTGAVFRYRREMPFEAYIAPAIAQLEKLVVQEASGNVVRKILDAIPLGRNRTGKDYVTDASRKLLELELTEELGVARIVLGVPKQIERSYGAMDYFTILTVHYSGRLKTAEEVEKQQRPSNFMPRDPTSLSGMHN